jgi:hypothetical protein
MTPAAIDRVFGRGRLRMVTGDHVEVFREESQPGERRRYTKRFLATPAGDFRQWTEREWRILARLGRPRHRPGARRGPVRPRRGGRQALVQTYDAGVTIDHWTTLLPVQRDGETLRHVFEDCAHWWALARHSLIALDAIHDLHLVHLDLKADNVCIPVGPVDFDPACAGARCSRTFERIALIDFAFSLVSGERLDSALPIAARPNSTTSRRACSRRWRKAAAATSGRPASSTGAATCSASRRCCAATCPSPSEDDACGWTAARRGQGAGAGAPSARGPRRRAAGGAAACRADRRDRRRAARSRARRFAAARLAARRAQSGRERRFADAGHPDRAAARLPLSPLRFVDSGNVIAIDPSDVEGWAAANPPPPRARPRRRAWIAGWPAGHRGRGRALARRGLAVVGRTRRRAARGRDAVGASRGDAAAARRCGAGRHEERSEGGRA